MDKGLPISGGCHSHFPQEAYFVDLLHGFRANPIPPVLLNILREPEQTTPHIKALILKFLELEGQVRGIIWHSLFFFQILLIHSVLFFGQYQRQTVTVRST